MCLCKFSFAQNVPAYVNTSGLMAWYSFTGNANDQSSNANNGTNYGAILTSDRHGNPNAAYQFNGNGNFIEIPNSNSLNPTEISMNVWIKPEGDNMCILEKNKFSNANKTSYRICHKDNWTQNSLGLTAAWGTTTSCTSTSAVSTSGSPASYVPNNTWSMITVVILANGTCYQYLNGQLFYTFNGTPFNSCNDSASKLKIGTHWQGETEWFKGAIDEIGLWNRPLTEGEITNLYNSCVLTITGQPSNQTLIEGTNASFSVATFGTPASYQWQANAGLGFQNISNLGQFSGANDSVLTVSNTTLANNNYLFRCIVNSLTCVDTTASAVLKVNPNNVEDVEIVHFTLSPNPATNEITINSDIVNNNYKIKNVVGQTIQEGRILDKKTTINITDLSSGVYFIQFDNKSLDKIKFIKK